MTGINKNFIPIQVQTGLHPSVDKAKPKKEKEVQAALPKQTQGESKIAPEKVLDQMAQAQSILPERASTQAKETASPKKVVQVGKYVNSESAKRIASYVQDFEKGIDSEIGLMNKEFDSIPGYTWMSDGAKTQLAVEAFNLLNMPDMVNIEPQPLV